MIPLLYYVPPLLGVGGLDIKAVAGVTMIQVLAATLMGAWTHGRHAMVHRPLAWSGGTAMALGSLAGAVGSHYVSGRVLLDDFAVMATLALPLLFVPPPLVPDDMRNEAVPFNRSAAIGLPGVIGSMSGLVGAGGAFLTVPVLIALIRIPVRLAIGTSLAMTSASAAMGALGKAATGQVPVVPTLAVVLGALGGAPLGALVSRRAPIAVLRGVLVVVTAVVAVRLWVEVLGG